MPKRDMLINYVGGEECRIAIVEDGKLEELYTERASDDIHVGNIYRGRVTNVEPAIQAAFVDFGLERNGFLHISDLHPRYFGKDDEATERVGKRTPRRDRPPIQNCLKRGQTLLVQVLKEGIGTKGPTLTSYLSIPGRFLVMMPDMERHGVSRKVEDEDQRREMRKILDELNPPEDFGFIVRTAGMGRTKSELKRDLAYLVRLWRTIDQRMKTGSGPAELYRESDLVIRTLRDVLNNDIERIVVDDRQAAQRARDFIRIALPRGGSKVLYYDRPVPLFDAFDIERQIQTINSRVVPLPSGGSLVIDTTEALVAIDVNSGKSRDKGDAESTAYSTNQEAVDEIARQLRLRDLGGVVVLDLIDMYQNKHRREIERKFKDNLKLDRARTKPLRINELGLLSLTRQRMRPSLKRSINKVCPTCDGMGVVKTAESVVLDVMRQLAVVLSVSNIASVELTVTPEVGQMLLNRKRDALIRLESQLGKKMHIVLDPSLRPDAIRLVASDARGVQFDIDKLPRPKPPVFTAKDEIDSTTAEGELLADEEPEEIEETAEAAPAVETSAGQPPAEVHADQQVAPEQGGEPGGSSHHRRRRRRRRGGGGGASQPAGESTDAPASHDAPVESDVAEPEPEQPDEAPQSQSRTSPPAESNGSDPSAPKKKRRRRGGRRHRRRRENAEQSRLAAEAAGGSATSPAAALPASAAPQPPALPAPVAPGSTWGDPEPQPSSHTDQSENE